MTPRPFLERFTVLETVASNDVEIVERAQDTLTLREVLLRRPGPRLRALFAHAGSRQRLLREARALARIDHPGVIRLLDALDTDEGIVLVLQPVAGETLAQRLEREPRLPAEDVRRIGMELCDALEAVHATGLIHRGIAEDAVVLQPDGRASLTGFVFAKHAGRDHQYTSIDYGKRTAGGAEDPASMVPRYVAPEQLAGRAADARTDLFALGCLLYRCLTGVTPFGEGAEPSVTRDAGALAPEAPRELTQAIHKCLARSPLARPGTAAALRALLAPPRSETSLSRPRAGLRAGPSAGRWPLVAGTALLAAVLLVGAGISWWRNAAQPGPTERGDSVAKGKAGQYQPLYANHRALIIGIGYGHESAWRVLPNAERDALAIHDHLRRLPGWKEPQADIQLLRGPEATVGAIRQALVRLEQAGRDDCVFIYYAGHGHRHERATKVGWIIPANGQGKDKQPQGAEATWIPYGELATFVNERLPAKHVLLALDCCFGGIATRAAARSGGTEAAAQAYLTRPAHVVMTSSRSSEEVSDGVAGTNSPFALAFLAALAQKDAGWVTSSTIMEGLRREALKTPRGAQPVISWRDEEQAPEFVFFLESEKGR